MNDLLVPIDKAGRVVLPKHVRDELDILPGDLLKISVRGNDVMLCPKRTATGLVRKGRALVFSTGGDDMLHPETVVKVLAATRLEREHPMEGKFSQPKRRK